MRPLASGTISFGLVSIPVKLFSATESSAAISFNMLHAKCGGRVKQQYICPRDDNAVVPREEMVKGKARPVKLYDPRADPGETFNLADTRTDQVAALSAEMDAWIGRRLQETGRPDPLIDQADALRIWQPRFIAGKHG